MRNTSAPAANSRAIMGASEEAGPSVATILARRNRLISKVSFFAAFGRRCRRRGAGRPLRGRRRARGQGPCWFLLGAVGQLHRPGALLAGVDFEEAGLVIAARQAVLAAANRELFLA